MHDASLSAEDMDGMSPDPTRRAFVALALARLERDHVALLAALCELEAGTPVDSSASPSLRDALATVLREDLRQTQRALDLAHQGTLGACERCHKPLATSLLFAQPATTRCAACAAVLERAAQVH